MEHSHEFDPLCLDPIEYEVGSYPDAAQPGLKIRTRRACEGPCSYSFCCVADVAQQPLGDFWRHMLSIVVVDVVKILSAAGAQNVLNSTLVKALSTAPDHFLDIERSPETRVEFADPDFDLRAQLVKGGHTVQELKADPVLCFLRKLRNFGDRQFQCARHRIIVAGAPGQANPSDASPLP